MSTISVRIPESLHRAVRDLAARESTSINQIITLALAEKVAALMTEEYLEARARRGDAERYRSALAKVSDVLPDERDQL